MTNVFLRNPSERRLPGHERRESAERGRDFKRRLEDMTGGGGMKRDLRRLVAREEEDMYPWESDMRPNGSVDLNLYANPYSLDGRGFYFTDLDEYQAGYDKEYKRARTEEYEIDFIDGSPLESALFKAMHVDQASLEKYFDLLDELDGDDESTVAAFLWLTGDIGYDVEKAIRKVRDVSLVAAKPEDYAYDFIRDVGMSEDWQSMYFDYDSFGRDLRLDGYPTRDIEDQIEEARESEDEDEVERLEAQLEDLERMTDQEIGEEYVDSVGGVMEVADAERYFDFEAFSRDAVLGGDWATFDYDGTEYTITNASEF
jgi:hypothetical protein